MNHTLKIRKQKNIHYENIQTKDTQKDIKTDGHTNRQTGRQRDK